MKSPLFICRIDQKDNFTFTIQWSTGTEQHFRLADLQRSCPCANCVNELTGERKLNVKPISEDVQAIAIRSVGRYALQIQFTSGCSSGIYRFEQLFQMV